MNTAIMSTLLKNGLQEVGKELLIAVKTLFEELPKRVKASDNLKIEQVDFLKSERLIELAKKYVVEGSNEVYVYRQKLDDKEVVNMCYGKDRDILPEDKNFFVSIEAEGLDRDVKDLFKENPLVILK